MSSAREHASIIKDYLSTEREAKRVLGPLDPAMLARYQVHYSPIGIIPKPHKPNKFRLIVDMSSPAEASVNDGIDSKLATLTYIRIQDVARQILQLGRGTLIAKIDIKSAYRIIPVHPDDRPLLGMQFQGKAYIDAALPFGLRSAPKIFNSVADALLWILQQHGVSHLLHYLDDFITFGPHASQQCETNCQIISALCELLGIPLATEKTEGPCTCLTYLGFRLDTVEMSVALPKEKLEALSALIKSWLSKKSCTKHELDSLIGKLQHASAVIKAGRSFLRRMIILSKSRQSPSHPLRLNQSFRSDLVWWHSFLKSWNGISMLAAIGQTELAFTLASDASGTWGCGAATGTQWFQLQWKPGHKLFSIAVLELVPIIIAGFVWEKKWANSHVKCLCDNQAVVAVIRSRYSRDDNIMHLLRCLFFVEASHGFTTVPEHIPGPLNTLADHISRNRLQSMFLQDPLMDQHPIALPPELPQVLLETQPDWLSKHWTDSFNTILSKV